MSRNTFYWLSPQMQEVLSQRRSRTFPTHSQQVRKVGQKELLETLYNAYMGHVMEWTESLGSHSGIELRHPLNDPQLIQYAFSTLTRLRLRGSRTKYVHVQALQNFMPRIILERKSKADFSIVFREHLDQMKGRLTETLPHERSAWVNLDGMGRLFQTYRDNPQLGWPLWILWSIHGCDETFG